MNASPKKTPLTPLRLVGILALAAIAWYAQSQGWIGGDQPAGDSIAGSSNHSQSSTATQSDGAGRIAAAVRAQESGFMVEVGGTVSRMLADDNEGSRHQRFIVTLSDGATVLVAHNIDLAPRVPLGQGDAVRVYGQYEWNDRGGVLHWTHHDPAKRHDEGWIEHQGKKYD